MGLLRRVTVYKVGEHVSALKNNNALNHYFPGQIVKVHKRPSVESTGGLYAEYGVAFRLLLHILSCFLFRAPKLVYDVKYADGTIDRELSPEYIRKLPQPPADS